MLLEREVGSAYSALEEREFEDWCMKLSPGEVLEIISTADFSVLDPFRMMPTGCPAKNSTRLILRAWRLRVNISATRCRRGLERELLKEVLTDTAPLHPEVRTFLEELVREQPGEDGRILAVRRKKEHSEEDRQRLTRAIRGLLL